ncbi:MAG: transglutaminase domain-containing protein [Leptolyngbyaceae cyanobacterium]
MRYQISHTTAYSYSQAIFLGSHTLRLRPRSDALQTLKQFSVTIDPTPEIVSDQIDLLGNVCTEISFLNASLTALKIQTHAEVETHCTNPFNYLLEPWATTLPIDYPNSILVGLTPYLQQPLTAPIAATVSDLAQKLVHEAEGNLSHFLTLLNQRIYDRCAYVVREQGAPLPASVTWQNQQGTCRDFAVLFMEVCRSVGVAARFVSGYQEGDPEQANHDLHAWIEVYIPGGGWRGFDPTHGLAVTDRHIALAVGAYPKQAAPVTGSIREGQLVKSTLETQISVKQLD